MGRGVVRTGGEVNRRSDLSRLLISEKTEYESRAIVYYRGRNGWDYSCCVKLNRPAAARLRYTTLRGYSCTLTRGAGGFSLPLFYVLPMYSKYSYL